MVGAHLKEQDLIIPFLYGYSCTDICPEGGYYKEATKQCFVCPAGEHTNVLITGSGEVVQCIDDEPTPEQCGPNETYYEGACRDTVSSPSECGENYATAISTPDGFVCSSNGDCPSNYSASIYTNANGSWNVCDPISDSSSSDSNSSAASSVATSQDSSSGTSDGGGSGSSSGATNSSASSSVGSGQGDTGDGLGDASAADCNSDPQCDGDPVQCAILVQLWINNCQGYSQNSSIDPEADLAAMGDQFSSLIGQSSNLVAGNGVLNALAGQGNGNGSGGSGDGDGSGNGYGLDELDSIASQSGSGTCPQDRQINLRLGNFAISYQPICDLASQLSSLVLLIYGYVSMLIVYRAIANS